MMDKPQRTFQILKEHAKVKPILEEKLKEQNPYKILVATLLSSRTRDETTVPVARRLFAKAPTPEGLAKLEVREIRKLIFPVGFYKTKAKQLKTLAQILLRDFSGQVPDKLKDLVKLPGVGRKTANLVLSRAFGVPAIAVDTHVHKISNLLGWVKTKTPEQTEKELSKILPKKYWSQINRVFVSLGQRYRSKKRLQEFLKEKGLA